MKYNCKSCGKCCENIANFLYSPQNIPELKALIDAFPYEVESDGSCSMLVDGKCSVYKDRPLLCQVGALGRHLGVNEKVWFKMNRNACKELRDG